MFNFFTKRVFVSILDDPEAGIDYDYTGIPADEMQKAKVLFETVGEVIGRSARTTISLQSNFYELGGNSLNSIYTVAKLRDRGYSIGITNFVTAKNLKEAFEHTKEIETNNGQNVVPVKADYVVCPLSEEFRDETIRYVEHVYIRKYFLFQLKISIFPFKMNIQRYCP